MSTGAPDNVQGATDASVRGGEVVVRGEPYVTAERNINRLSPRHVFWVRAHDGRLIACAQARNARGETKMRVLRLEACKHIWRGVSDFAALPDAVIVATGVTRPFAPPAFVAFMRQLHAPESTPSTKRARCASPETYDTSLAPPPQDVLHASRPAAPPDFFRVSGHQCATTSTLSTANANAALLHALLRGARAAGPATDTGTLAALKSVADLQAFPQRALLIQFHTFFFPLVHTK